MTAADASAPGPYPTSSGNSVRARRGDAMNPPPRRARTELPLLVG